MGFILLKLWSIGNQSHLMGKRITELTLLKNYIQDFSLSIRAFHNLPVAQYVCHMYISVPLWGTSRQVPSEDLSFGTTVTRL